MAARRGIAPPKRTISALQRNQSPLTCTYEYFHAEPAIAQLDWTFTPIPSSSERFADQQRFDPPPIFQRASIWPGIDRRASGPPPLTPSEHTSSLTVKLLRTCRFPFGYVDQPLNLANDQDSLGHFSKRTTGRCSYLRFHAQSACTQLVSRSFHIPLRILFSFHSRYL